MISIPTHMLEDYVAYTLDMDAPSSRDNTLIEVEKEVAQTIFDSLQIQLEEVGGCDHSVGICACEWLDEMEELARALRGMRFCPECGGEGFTVGESDDGYDYRMDNCNMCKGKGEVPAKNSSPAMSESIGASQ